MGLYRGTYIQRKVIKLAPDAIILVNEKPTIELCPVCKYRINMTDYVSTVSTNLDINGTVGTASFNIAMPRHGHSGNYMVRNGRVYGINLMDEIEVYIKSRYPISTGEHQYYRVFWGLITNIGESYSEGNQNIAVSCESILKWLQLMMTNEHPSLIDRQNPQLAASIGDNNLITGKAYSNQNVYQIIHSLVSINFLNIVVPAALRTSESISQTNSQEVGVGSISTKDIELMEYWKNRFLNIKGSLKMFGTTQESFGKKETPNKTAAKLASNDNSISVHTDPLTPAKIAYDSKALLDFKPFNTFDDKKDLDLMASSYKNNLEMVNEIKLFTGYEFYLDTNGDIIFKPPFWNLDTRENPIYRISDSDIISWSFSENENVIKTRADVTGNPIQQLRTSTTTQRKASYTEYALARQFGIRAIAIPGRFLNTTNMCYYHAISELDRINSGRYKGSITIIGRAELRLGMPIYIESRDIFGYVENISHNFTFGGQHTTDIQITAIRRKYLGDDPASASSFRERGNSTKKFEIKGRPAILIHVKNASEVDDLQDLTDKAREIIRNKVITLTKDKQAKAERIQAVKSNEFFKSNRIGEYIEFPLNSSTAQKILQEAQKAKNDNNQEGYLNFLEKAIPVSDEDGYELIGSYENGRSLKLTAGNVLDKKANSFSALLAQSLNKAEGVSKNWKKYNYSKSTTFIVESDSGTVSGLEKSEARAAGSVRNFMDSKVQSLRKLSPNTSNANTSCSCFDVGLTHKKIDEKKSNKSKPINKVNK